MDVLFIVLGLVALVGIWIILLYNGLIKGKLRVDEAWSDITVQLKRRADLIPNLINTVKGYAKHEKEVFENVTKARSALLGANGVEESAKAENMMTGALKSLFAVAESYPDLKANENFKALQDELVDTEDKIQASRRFYNTNVRDFNTKIQVFPNTLFASMLKFTLFEFFEVEDKEAIENPVEVKF
jgi:LemA protein